MNKENETMKMNPTLWMVCLLWLGGWALAGCAESGPTGPATLEGAVAFNGTVTMDGKPVEGATVQFIPLGSATGNTQVAGASAITGADGKYSMDPANNTGVLPGQYRVAISRMLKADGTPASAAGMVPPAQLMAEGAKESIAPAQSSVIDSRLTATVPPSGGTADFEVQAAP